MINIQNESLNSIQIEEQSNKSWVHKQNKLIAENMRQNLAKRIASNIWGGGFKFNTNDATLDKAFLKLDRNNRLNQLFSYAEYLKSIYGRAIYTINKTKTGLIMINITDPYFLSQVGKCFVTETLAVIYQRIVTDYQHYFLKTTYDTEKVINEWYTDQEFKTLVFDTEVAIPKKLQVEKVWHHNLGFVPVVESYNKPYRNIFFNLYNFQELADWYNSAFLEPVFVDTLLNFQKEINFTHSRIVFENASQQLIETLNSQSLNPNFKFGDYIIASEVGSKTQPVPGTTDFTKYTQALNEIMDLYYKFACASKFSEGGGAQKTTAEANQTRSATIENVKQKITNNEYDCSILIAKCLAAMGAINYEEDWNFKFEIVGNIDSQDTVYLDNIIKQVNMGTMSAVEAVANLRHISIQEATKIFEKIQEFNKANDIITNMSSVEDAINGFEGSSRKLDEGRPTEENKEEGGND